VLLGVACARWIVPAPHAQAPAGCTFNADCPDELVCAAGTCRAQCQTNRDCTAPATCRPSNQRSVLVCLAPQEPALCFYNSDCTTPLTCARDGLCRAQCVANVDCPSGNCDTVQGVCAGTPPLSDGGVVSGDAGACPAPLLVCSNSCVDPRSDISHCGGCAPCGQLEGCFNGLCAVPSGDHCVQDAPDGVIPVGLPTSNAASLTSVTLSMANATDDGARSCDARPDVFVKVHVGFGFIAATVSGGASLSRLTHCEGTPLECGGGPCGASTWAGRPGEDVLFAIDSNQPTVTLDIHRLGTGFDERVVGPLLTGTTLGDTALGATARETCGPGDDVFYHLVTCDGEPPRTLTANTCATPPDADGGTLLELRSTVLTLPRCNSEPCAVGTGAQLTVDLPATFGLYFLGVDGRTSGQGPFVLETAFPAR
jgi:hypothetical protein